MYIDLKDIINQTDTEFLISPNGGYSFGKVSKINIVVGANNSRKSRFLRSLVKANTFRCATDDIWCLQPQIEEFCRRIRDQIENYNIGCRVIIKGTKGNTAGTEKLSKRKNIIELINAGHQSDFQLNEKYFTDLIDSFNNYFENIDKKYKELKDHSKAVKALLGVMWDYRMNQEELNGLVYFGANNNDFSLLDPDLQILYGLFEILSQIHFTIVSPEKVYVPTLRTAVSLFQSHSNDKINTDIFYSTIKKNYDFKDSSELLSVFTGLSLYKQIKKDRNSPKEVRTRFLDFENFLSKNFFDGREIDIVALEEDKDSERHIQIFIKGEEDRYIHDLGDGIQSLIICMYPIFMAKENSWIFIEEPELNLHPGLQHVFLKTILNDPAIQKKNLTFFLSTHSNHLLDLSLRDNNSVSIFSFKNQIESGYSLISQITGGDINLLDLLGVYNSSVFMSNCSIWVEGVSDRRYVKAYLRAYIDSLPNEQRTLSLHEDLHYSFFEYAGSNLKHYLFESKEDESKDKIIANFLANRIFLLADKDEGKEEYHSSLEEIEIRNPNLNFKFNTTGAIEIENTLSPEILKLIAKNILKVDDKIFERWNLIHEDYENVRLGRFLKDYFVQKVHNFPAIMSKKSSGTLTTEYKNKFSQFVLDCVESKIITWEMIKSNKHAVEITTRIYNFIKFQNSPIGSIYYKEIEGIKREHAV